MDPVNQKILELIRNNARMSYSDIGKSVGTSRRYLRNMRKSSKLSGRIRS